MALGDPYCTLTDTCSCGACRLRDLSSEVETLRAEQDAWREIANWQDEDQFVRWTSGAVEAHVRGKGVVARGTAVLVAKALGLAGG